jgi:hypothetical protein
MDVKATETSFSKGYEFEFQYREHRILARASAKSGVETVLVDGEEVSRRLNWRRRSVHSFSLDGQKLDVEFHLANMLTCELHCTLIVDDTHDATQKQRLQASQRFSKKRLLVHFVCGAVFGFVGMQLVLKWWGI